MALKTSDVVEERATIRIYSVIDTCQAFRDDSSHSLPMATFHLPMATLHGFRHPLRDREGQTKERLVEALSCAPNAATTFRARGTDASMAQLHASRQTDPVHVVELTPGA